jgi:hypothetical protein
LLRTLMRIRNRLPKMMQTHRIQIWITNKSRLSSKRNFHASKVVTLDQFDSNFNLNRTDSVFEKELAMLGNLVHDHYMMITFKFYEWRWWVMQGLRDRDVARRLQLHLSEHCITTVWCDASFVDAGWYRIHH